jgi:hypothetical protein
MTNVVTSLILEFHYSKFPQALCECVDMMVKGSYERLEGGWIGATQIFNSFQVKARQEGKFSRCDTKWIYLEWQAS